MTLDKKEVGKRIKEARKIKSEKIGKKYTGQNLADELGISRSYLGDIEAGRNYPSYRLLSKIATICEIPLSFFGDTDTVLKEIIGTTFPNMDSNDQIALFEFIKKTIKSPYGVVDWDLSTWKDAYDDFKRNEYVRKLEEEDKKNEIEFKTPQEAIKFILEQPAIMGYGGFDVNKMSDEDVINFANELLSQLKLLGYKYNK